MAETEHSIPALDTPRTGLEFRSQARVTYERTMMAWIRTATSLVTFGVRRLQILSDYRRPIEQRGVTI